MESDSAQANTDSEQCWPIFYFWQFNFLDLAQSKKIFWPLKISFRMQRIWVHMLNFLKKIDNPTLTNTAESQTPRRQPLRRVSKFIFQKSKSFYSNTAQSRTPCRLILRGVLPASILYVQASPCLNRESKIRKYRVTTYMKIAQHFC